MDISSMLIGSSDQLDNVDLISGPRDFTITAVTEGSSDQPLNIALAEFPRPWRPGLTMRRLLAEIWGSDASTFVGRRVRLFRDESVKFGPTTPGGTRISHASHITETKRVTLPISRGKVAVFVVEPLPDAPPTQQQPPEPTAQQVANCTDLDELKAMWEQSGPERRAQIEARAAEIKTSQEAQG